MRVVMRPISRLKPYEMNPRINDAAVEAVARSIQEFGFRQPIVVDTDDVIICGHTRWKAALMLGIKKVPVHVAKDLTPKQVRAYRIADNKLAEVAEWDMELLPLELVDLQSDGVDLGLLGFLDDDLAELFGDGAADRVVSGDTTKAESIVQLRKRIAALETALIPFGEVWLHWKREGYKLKDFTCIVQVMGYDHPELDIPLKDFRNAHNTLRKKLK